MEFYICIESCTFEGAAYRKGRVYGFPSAPTGDGSEYFEAFDRELRKPAHFMTSKGLRGTMYFDSEGWNDLRFPLQNVKINPATSKPDFDFNNVDFLFDDATTETVVGVGQMDHDWKQESAVYPHVHWTQSAAGVVKWQLDYKFWYPGTPEPGWTTLTTVITSQTYVSGDLGQISVFPAIDTTGLKVSFMMKFRLARLGGDAADTMVGDAKFYEFDIHYRKDSWGSGESYRK